MSTHNYSYELDDGTLECEFEVEGPSRGARENGIQMEPDYDEEFYLLSVLCSGVELIDILDESFKEKILDAISSNFPQDEPDYDPPEHDYYEER